MRPSRRHLLAIVASLALHAALVAVVLGKAVWQGWRMSRTVDIELTSMKTEEVKRLPFGPPPPTAGQNKQVKRRAARAADDGMKVAAKDAGAGDAAPVADAGTDAQDAGDAREAGVPDARPGPARDLRAYGPEGSRLTVILRLDRLRDSPEAPATIAAVDALLRHLPDRRRLLDGTGLDLYRDFEALLVATPNPMDDTVTFLAARHKLADDALKEALARGAEASGRTLQWREQGGRPVGVRRRQAGGSDPSVVPQMQDRDDRLMILPGPGLAVMAPPAYAALLLPAEPNPDGGAPSASVKSTRAAAAAARWQELIRNIDAQDALPEGTVLMMTAANLVSRKKPGAGARADDDVEQLAMPGGLALPSYATALVGTTPAPTLEVISEFDKVADARGWEERWPGLKRELLQSPLLLLSGFSSIVAQAELSRDGSTVVLRTRSTTRDLQRILMFIGNMIPGARRGRAQ